MVREWHEGREQSIWPAYEMEGNPRKLGDPLLPGFFSFNVTFGHQRSWDTWLPSCNGSHVRSKKLETEQASTPSVIFSLSNFPPTVYSFFFTYISSFCFVFFNPLHLLYWICFSQRPFHLANGRLFLPSPPRWCLIVNSHNKDLSVFISILPFLMSNQRYHSWITSCFCEGSSNI